MELDGVVVTHLDLLVVVVSRRIGIKLWLHSSSDLDVSDLLPGEEPSDDGLDLDNKGHLIHGKSWSGSDLVIECDDIALFIDCVSLAASSHPLYDYNYIKISRSRGIIIYFNLK